jgi:predicted dehydrogenase
VAGGLMAKESKSPNERIAMACIGIDGKGDDDTASAAKFTDIVAICDVDLISLHKKGSEKYPNAKRFVDFRNLLDEMGKSIDAVTVSTPDHTHAPASLMAMRMGKHCFCQKPLTHTIYEARMMAKVASEMKVATQMGNQGTADDPLRQAVAIVKSGVLGTVKEVHVWTNRPIWAQGGPRPEARPVPVTLDWNLWLGPAPVRPYANGYHNFAWRGYWDFGTGALGDMACHTANMPYMALKLFDPTSVQAVTSGHNGDSYPKWSKITFDFPAKDDRGPVKLFWYDGGKFPTGQWMTQAKKLYREDADEEEQGDSNPLGTGSVIIGDKDTLIVPGDYAGGPHKLLSGSALPEVDFVHSPGHVEEWIRAIKGGEPAVSNFPDYAGGLTETILLGNLAVWVAAAKGDKDENGVKVEDPVADSEEDAEKLAEARKEADAKKVAYGAKVEWDAKNLKCTNIPGLETIIKPVYRPGYTLDV